MSYIPQLGLPLVTHTLVGCEFLKDNVKAQSGDKSMDVELDLIVMDILGL